MFPKKHFRNNTEETRNKTLRQLILKFEDIDKNVQLILKLLSKKEEPRLNNAFSRLHVSINEVIRVLNTEIT